MDRHCFFECIKEGTASCRRHRTVERILSQTITENRRFGPDRLRPEDFGKDLLLYCTVLYLYIYIALIAVHTNQKRFQCERPREKRAVLRERKEALCSPVNKVDRVEGRSWFQSEGPMIAKARV